MPTIAAVLGWQLHDVVHALHVQLLLIDVRTSAQAAAGSVHRRDIVHSSAFRQRRSHLTRFLSEEEVIFSLGLYCTALNNAIYCILHGTYYCLTILLIDMVVFRPPHASHSNNFRLRFYY